MDRGIPTEETLAQMREMGASYLVGTPKGRLSKLERSFLSASWERVRDGVQVKRRPQESETYVLAVSESRIGKERGMRQRRLKRYVERLKQCRTQSLEQWRPRVRRVDTHQRVERQSGLPSDDLECVDSTHLLPHSPREIDR